MSLITALKKAALAVAKNRQLKIPDGFNAESPGLGDPARALLRRVAASHPAEEWTPASVMLWLYKMAHGLMVYTQGPERMEGVVKKIEPPKWPAHADCSALATWAYWVSDRPDPNHLSFNGTGYCHEPSARLLTSDLRWIPAGDMKVGQELWAFDEEPERFPGNTKGRRYRRATIVASFPSMKECVRVCLDTGETFVCSTDHPWLTQTQRGHNHNWTPADQLLPDGVVRTLVRPFIPWEPDTSYEAGWLAGMYDGEGWVANRGCRGGRTHGVGITQTLGPTADRLVELTSRYGGFAVSTIERPRLKPRINIESNGGGIAHAAAFLGTIRAERLIAGFNLEAGHVIARQRPAVVAIEPVGLREVQSIQTTTGTYLAEGFAVHNTGTLASNGKVVRLSDAQPGDLVFYSNPDHVAVYVGNGRVVGFGHSGGPDLDPVGYRPVHEVRRYPA